MPGVWQLPQRPEEKQGREAIEGAVMSVHLGRRKCWLQYLKDPVGTGQEARQTEGEHVVSRETLHHFGVLHHAELRENGDGLEVHAQSPQYLPVARNVHGESAGKYCIPVQVLGQQSRLADTRPSSRKTSACMASLGSKHALTRWTMKWLVPGFAIKARATHGPTCGQEQSCLKANKSELSDKRAVHGCGTAWCGVARGRAVPQRGG